MNPNDLLSQQGFCILPFVHSCIFQNGNAQPCCINHLKLGNTKIKSLKEIYSNKNKNLTDLRKELLSDRLPASCVKCEDIESKYDGLSYRNHSNNTYGYLLNYIDISNEESLINNEKIFLWDVRFSNLCNLKCLICRPMDSSRVAEEEEGKLINAFNDVDDFIIEFEKHIDNIVEINFAGGEPLLIKDHYKILELLIKYEKFDVVLRYNTNGTTIVLGDKDVIEYWKYFKNVQYNVSLDAGWKQFEYLRYGANWEIVLQNLRRIRYFSPHVSISVNIVIMALNILYTRQLYECLVNEGLIGTGYLNFIPLSGKEYYQVSILPANLKEQALQYYQDWENSLKNSGQLVLIQLIQMVKNMITNDKDTSHKLPELKKRTLIKDKIRGTNFYETFPELKDIFKDI